MDTKGIFQQINDFIHSMQNFQWDTMINKSEINGSRMLKIILYDVESLLSQGYELKQAIRKTLGQ